MTVIKTVLFDLDGTLTDSAEGILRCLQYALERMEHPCPPPEVLSSHIGPPLRQTFATLFESSEEKRIAQAVALYRERFAVTGMYENRVYSGVPEMLAELRAQSCNLFVATAKVTFYARKILEHFELDSHFTAIQGSELDGRFEDKAHLVAELVAQHNLTPSETLMVGDRRHDIVAARKNGVRSLGVTYGYGSRDELAAAGADYIVDSPAEVLACIHASRKPGR